MGFALNVLLWNWLDKRRTDSEKLRDQYRQLLQVFPLGYQFVENIDLHLSM